MFEISWLMCVILMLLLRNTDLSWVLVGWLVCDSLLDCMLCVVLGWFWL